MRYNGAPLTQLIEKGIAGLPDIEAAAAGFRTAQGLARQAGAALQPGIDAFGKSEFKKQEDLPVALEGAGIPQIFLS